MTCGTKLQDHDFISSNRPCFATLRTFEEILDRSPGLLHPVALIENVAEIAVEQGRQDLLGFASSQARGSAGEGWFTSMISDLGKLFARADVRLTTERGHTRGQFSAVGPDMHPPHFAIYNASVGQSIARDLLHLVRPAVRSLYGCAYWRPNSRFTSGSSKSRHDLCQPSNICSPKERVYSRENSPCGFPCRPKFR
ncbi:hypothetical protein BKA93DRAFT_135894 [Sparassis latifolia]